MRTRRLLAAFGIPLVAMACATGSTPVISSGDGGGSSGDTDASYGADDASTGSDGGTGSGIDSGGSHGIEAGVTDSGGGGGGPIETPGGDCIGDPQAPFGYDFACGLDEALNDDEPCTPDAGMCGAGACCFTDPASDCYASYGPQCVPTGM